MQILSRLHGCIKNAAPEGFRASLKLLAASSIVRLSEPWLCVKAALQAAAATPCQRYDIDDIFQNL